MEKILKVKVLDVWEGRYEVILNIEDAKDLGIYPKDRVKLFKDGASTVAIVNTTPTFVKEGEICVLAEIAKAWDLKDGDSLSIAPAGRPTSIEYIRKKMRGMSLGEKEYEAIVKDVVANNLSEVELTAFISALYINEMTMKETVALTKKMAETGVMLKLKRKPVFDKHSIGGVPGNKITLLIVPIVAAAGLTIPKTSSRAITSACGTADIMEVLAPVAFDAREIEKIVNKTNGIVAWGGGVNLAPADDVFISVEYPLAIDPRNLVLCSVMAKKYAVGANFVVIDIPMGRGTKVGSMKEAKSLAKDFMTLGKSLGIKVEGAITFGDKPIGRAIGPALEAREALRALEGEGPSSLIEKSCDIAGIILEASGKAVKGKGKEKAKEILGSGKALEKMREIIEAQGGDQRITSKEIEVGRFKKKVTSSRSGYVTQMDNIGIIQIARAAGAPKDKGAGLLLHIKKGEKVEEGGVLFEVFSESRYKLKHAIELAEEIQPIILEGMLLKRITEYAFFEH